MELSFLDTLKLARQHNIMTGKLCVAEEVNAMFDFEEDIKEELCKLVYSIYLSSDYLEPVHICLGINGFLENDKTVDEVLQMDEDEICEQADYYYFN